jgi:hypothetical protein
MLYYLLAVFVKSSKKSLSYGRYMDLMSELAFILCQSLMRRTFKKFRPLILVTVSDFRLNQSSFVRYFVSEPGKVCDV